MTLYSPETHRSGFLCFVLAQRGLLQQFGYVWLLVYSSVSSLWHHRHASYLKYGTLGNFLGIKRMKLWSVWVGILWWRNPGLLVVSQILCWSRYVVGVVAFFGTQDEEGKTSPKENTHWRSLKFWGITQTCPELILSGDILFFAPVFWISLFL